MLVGRVLIYIYIYILRSRHELEYNILNEVVIKEGYIRVTIRVKYKDIWIKKKSLPYTRYEV